MSLSRGSEWGYWDLHLHSPATHLANQYDKSPAGWELFYKAICDRTCAGIGITNYFHFADSELEKVREGIKSRGKSTAVIGNLEFRIQQPNKDGEYINVHVLFSDQLSTALINEKVAHLKLVNTTTSNQPIYCSDRQLLENKISHGDAMVDFQMLKTCLQDNFKHNEYFIVCCLGGYGSMRPEKSIANEGRGAALATELDKQSSAFFGAQSSRDFALNEQRYLGALPKPVFRGSDAHSIDKVCKDGVWIKCEPHFDGLLQTTFEPDDRVSFDIESPSSRFNKPFFGSIFVKGHPINEQSLIFEELEIPLNRDLVVIIGGRGTGKSLLLDIVWRLMHTPVAKDSLRYKSLDVQNASCTYIKATNELPITLAANQEDVLQYLHVRQGDVKTIVENPDHLSTEVMQLIGIDPKGNHFFGNDEEKFIEIQSQLQAKLAWLNDRNPENLLVNTPEFQEKAIDHLEKQVEILTNKSNQKLLSELKNSADKFAQLEEVKNQITSLIEEVAGFDEILNREIQEINLKLESKITSKSFVVLNSELNEASIFTEQSMDIQVAKIESTRKQLIDAGVDSAIDGTFEKVELLQRGISEARRSLEMVQKNKADCLKLKDQRSNLALSSIERLIQSAQLITERFKKLRILNKELSIDQQDLMEQLLKDIEIEGEVKFNEARFYESLKNVLNLGKFRATTSQTNLEKIKSRLPIKNLNDFKAFISDKSLISDELGVLPDIPLSSWLAQEEYFLMNSKVTAAQLFFDPRQVRQFIEVHPSIKYKGKKLDQLSVGQRGTFYIAMKLATDPFGSPLVYDQPEDDLDNNFIVTELVPLLRKVKKYRQVILATHNANIVVNADADQVIVADNQNEKISYSAGAIETRTPLDIRQKICDVLEGGGVAFRRRERRYGERIN